MKRRETMYQSGDCGSMKGHGEGSCSCESRHEKFIDPCLLLLIAQDPSHGYDLIERLKKYGFDGVDPTRVYRRLRHLEDCGFLESAWSTDTPGPARRAYRITKEGLDFLQTWPPAVQRSIESYKSFIDDLTALKNKGQKG
jgi:PadR family transcriptional regulator PadR